MTVRMLTAEERWAVLGGLRLTPAEPEARLEADDAPLDPARLPEDADVGGRVADEPGS